MNDLKIKTLNYQNSLKLLCFFFISNSFNFFLLLSNPLKYNFKNWQARLIFLILIFFFQPWLMYLLHAKGEGAYSIPNKVDIFKSVQCRPSLGSTSSHNPSFCPSVIPSHSYLTRIFFSRFFVDRVYLHLVFCLLSEEVYNSVKRFFNPPQIENSLFRCWGYFWRPPTWLSRAGPSWRPSSSGEMPSRKFFSPPGDDDVPVKHKTWVFMCLRIHTE